jgi:hypothetical protein
MSDVFLKYGNSTKRVDNKLTGGFGIGAKTPFTYTDTFTVVTVTLDDDKIKRRRTYVAHKADDGIQMSLITAEDTSDETGTSISFAVDKKDFYDFETAVRNVCSYWKVRPTIKGHKDWRWNDEKVVHSGTNWTLAEGDGSIKILIDCIPYTLRLGEIYEDRYCDEHRLLNNTKVRLHFNTGEVDVSATREDLDYKDRTVALIKARVKVLFDELRAHVSKSVAKAASLWEASIAWAKLSNRYKDYLVEPKWNGKDLLPSSIHIRTSVKADKVVGAPDPNGWLSGKDHVKVTVFENLGGQIVSKKGGWNKRSIIREIRVRPTTLVALDDTQKSRPNKLRVETLFDTNPGITEIAVVTFKTDLGEAIANATMHWADIPHTILSTIPKAKNKNAGAKGSGKAYTVNAVKKLESGYSSYKWTPVKDRAPEDTDGGVYVIIKNGKPVLADGTPIHKDTVARMERLLKEDTIYGILYKYRNKISSDWEEISAKAVLKAGELRSKKTVQDYITHGGTNLDGIFGRHISRQLPSMVGELKDKRFTSIVTNSALADAGKEDWNRYQNIMACMHKAPDGPKTVWVGKAILKDYPIIKKWNDMFTYYASDKENKTIGNELIFYLNAKYAAKVAAQGDSNGNS